MSKKPIYEELEKRVRGTWRLKIIKRAVQMCFEAKARLE